MSTMDQCIATIRSRSLARTRLALQVLELARVPERRKEREPQPTNGDRSRLRATGRGSTVRDARQRRGDLEVIGIECRGVRLR